MFSRIARCYDRANRILSGGIDVWWRRRLVGAVKQTHPGNVLDLATGSGDVAFALSRQLPKTAKITGMDFCQPMLDEAVQKKASSDANRYDNVDFRLGDGLALPLDNALFDAVTIAFGLRNMADRHRSLTEMNRVLTPGGKLFVLEFSQPQRWLRPFYFFYLRRILPLVAGVVTGDRSAYVYLNNTIAQFPDAPALATEIAAAGFTKISIHRLTFGVVALHVATK